MTKRYSGKLAKPIEAKLSPKGLGEYLTWNAVHQDQLLSGTIGAAVEEKIPLLFEHFGITQTGTDLDYRVLAVALAATYVPGFQIVDPASKTKAGRKIKWTDERHIKLFADVEALKRDKHLSSRGACRVLSKAPRYKARWGGISMKTLQEELRKARKSNTNFVMDLVNRAKDDDDREHLISRIIDRHGVPKKKK